MSDKDPNAIPCSNNAQQDVSTSSFFDHRPPGYGFHLGRRMGSAVFYLAITIVLIHCSVYTTLGQSVDTVLMEAVMEWKGIFGIIGGYLTRLVSIYAIIIVAVCVLIIALVRNRIHLTIRAVAVVAGANLTTQLLKAILVRPSFGNSMSLANSLPSGHTAFAASVALAFIIVAPRSIRTMVACFGWIWTSLMGVIVIANAWHRPSDVVVAILISAIWAQIMAPMEYGQRSGQMVRRFAIALSVVFMLASVVLIIWQLRGIDVPAQFVPGSSDHGFGLFLSQSHQQAQLLASGAVMGIIGTAGLVMFELDSLLWSKKQEL